MININHDKQSGKNYQQSDSDICLSKLLNHHLKWTRNERYVGTQKNALPLIS